MDNGLSVKDGARDCDHGVEIHALGKGAGKPSSGELAATGKSGSASGWPTFLKNWKTMVFLGREWSLLLLGWSQPRVLPLLRTTYYCNCILNSRALSTDRRTDVILPVGQKLERKGEEGAEQPVWRTENRRDAAGPEAGRLVRTRGDVEMSGTRAAEPVQPAGRPEQAPAGPEVSASPPTRTEHSGAAGARGAGQGCAGSARGGGRAGRAAHRRPNPCCLSGLHPWHRTATLQPAAPRLVSVMS